MGGETKSESLFDSTQKTFLQQFSQIVERSKQLNILFGFDGFIDNIFQVLKKRYTLADYTIMEKITEFSERIAAAAGSSANMEVILKKQTTGGFVANTCRGIASLQSFGGNISMIGCFGTPEMDPLFTDLSVKKFNCTLTTIGIPGKTNAYEFNDGKIMISEFTGVHKLTMETILNGYGKEKLKNSIFRADLFGIGYWSIGPHMTSIFKGLLDIMEELPQKARKIKLFFDLADVKKKPVEDLRVAVNILRDFCETADVTVSVNDKEAESLALSLDIEVLKNQDNTTKFEVVGENIHRRLDITRFIIHSPKNAYGWLKRDSNSNEKAIIPQAYTSKAKFTTSAGDMFNSGLCVALLSDVPLEMALLMGNIMSAFFIRTGYAPSPKEFQIFLKNYRTYLSEDITEIIQ